MCFSQREVLLEIKAVCLLQTGSAGEGGGDRPFGTSLASGLKLRNFLELFCVLKKLLEGYSNVPLLKLFNEHLIKGYLFR